MDLQYAMVIEPAGNGQGTFYFAYFPDLRGCSTLGATLDELRENAVDAVAGHIQALKEHGKPVPLPRARIDTVAVMAS